MRALTLVFFGAVLSTAALASDGPNFSGTWKLDPLRSRFDAIKTPRDLVLKIDQQDPRINITIAGKADISEVYELSTDGTEQKLTLEGRPAKASAEWDGESLILTVTRETADGPVVETRRAKLGDKGKMLTTILTIRNKAGEKTVYGFYTKE